MATHYLIKGETLIDIADAIREKTGSDSPIAAEDMAEIIENISQGGEISPTREPVLLESVDIATLPEPVNRITLSVAGKDLSKYSIIWVVGDAVEFSANDWLYFSDGQSNIYLKQSSLFFNFSLVFYVRFDVWRAVQIHGSYMCHPNAGNIEYISDIAFFPYSSNTKFTSGVLKLYAI